MITLIIGRQGSGKTLLAIKLLWEYFKKGKKIYSNVKLKFRFSLIKYNDIVNCVYENAVVFIDEIGQLLSNRLSMTKISIAITNGFLSMVRKKNLELIGTTQTLRKCDVKLREELDGIIEVRKYAKINNKWSLVMHNQDLPLNVPVLVKGFYREFYDYKETEFSFIGNPYFKLYDSREIIKIEGLDI